jgi:hypothetical protein
LEIKCVGFHVNMCVLKPMLCAQTVIQRGGMGCGGKQADTIDLDEAIIAICHVTDDVVRLYGRLQTSGHNDVTKVIKDMTGGCPPDPHCQQSLSAQTY